jgi:alcohol dehydrogenase
VIDKLLANSAASALHVFTGVKPNPTIESVSIAAADVLSSEPELLMSIGGGSAIDTAKAVAAIAGAAGMNSDWLGRHFRESIPFPASFAPPPIIAVPTTAGTGSEVTMWGTVYDERDGTKYSISHQSLYPEAALLVPELTSTMDSELTLITGLDAMSHCLESMWNRRATTVSDAFARKGLTQIVRFLPLAVRDGGDMSIRAAMQNAALMGGLAISSTATALAHSMSYPLTARLGMPHGLACSFTLPALMEFNGNAAPERTDLVARALGATATAEGVAKLRHLFDELGVKALVARYLQPGGAAAFQDKLLTPGRADNNVAPATSRDALRLIERSLQ